jgi:formylglycine-generating enzyme required for sulfatase activity
VRLPIEAEREKAARGGLEVPSCPPLGAAGERRQAVAQRPNPLPARRFPWGDKVDLDHANTKDTAIGSPSAVGCFPTAASPYGCEQMSGNVWEWTASPWTGSARRSGTLRVLRGGGFHDPPRKTVTACREWGDPDLAMIDDGFRIVVAPVAANDAHGHRRPEGG